MGVIGTICIVSELLHQVKLVKIGHAGPIGGRLYELPEASGGAAMSIFRVLGSNLHVMAVCQPAVPVLAAVSLMEEVCDPHTPASVILLGGPIDTRVNPTVINRFAEQRSTEWFRQNVITKVPFMYRGFLRDVYPGFIQLSSFMSINLDRHIGRHQEFFLDLMRGDQASAQKHRAFYDEYLAVMDLTAELFLQTIDTVFVHHRLAKREMTRRRGLVRPLAIRHVALMVLVQTGKRTAYLA